jgi:hypothetical protein
VAEHAGRGHGDVTLSLTTRAGDGSHYIRSWTICECSVLVKRLEPLLGPPEWESAASGDAVEEIARRTLGVPGNVVTGDGDG